MVPGEGTNMINESRGMGELSDGEMVDLGWK